MTNQKRIFDYYSIIPHPTEPKLLMQEVNIGWSLPHFIPSKTHFAHAYLINEAMQQQLGIDVTVLSCIYNDLDPVLNRVNRVFALANHNPDWQPTARYRWIDRSELNKLALAVPEHYPILLNWFQEIQDPTISSQRVPWARIGWYKKANDWIYEQFKNLGLTSISRSEQLRSWSTSCILKFNTTAGNIYFKAMPSALKNESLFTKALGEYYPENTPHILSANHEQHWMLMRDFGGTPLSEMAEISYWEEALRLFAKIQIDSVDRVDDLLSLGWCDRKIERLPFDIDLLLADTAALLAGDFIIIEESDVEELRALIPQFKVKCEKLASYNLPQTLVHGDFWAKNVVVNHNNYIYIDWPNSAISHPFFDIVNFLYIEKYVPDLPGVRDRLRNVYLEQWTSYEPMERLLEAFELSQTLGMLYQAITYYRIVSQLEPLAKWEIEVAVPLCLEKLLIFHRR
ncbi:MAG TPA: phosphotransferase [Leptolyngbyaceae cyanobacterium]